MISANIVATLRTCYSDKFGIPRQSGLAPDAWGIIEFTSPFRRLEAIRGIEAFSHLWLITQFHLVPDDTISLTVRPPRLGGNEQKGVFATRSPFRPNRLGLSVVKLERIELDGDASPRLFVSGVDLVDHTPILDIKPYIRYADSLPQAFSGFADTQPNVILVQWCCSSPPIDQDRRLIEQSLSLQPQPAYHTDTQREYVTEIGGWQVRWSVCDEHALIKSCDPIE
jgi:tRNA (adenine37-N6)-methyltransferase